MIGQELKSLSHAQNLFTRLLGILGGDKVKEPFEVGKRSLGYFDRRHARALGRRALAPDARAASNQRQLRAQRPFRSKALPLPNVLPRRRSAL
jgi:hypothetical protein